MSSHSLSRKTARLTDNISISARQTRSSSRTSRFFQQTPSSLSSTRLNNDIEAFSDISSLSSANTTDIEDLLPKNPSKRRKIFSEPPLKQSKSPQTRTKLIESHHDATVKDEPNTSPRKKPGKRIVASSKPVTAVPPPNWEIVYTTVKAMRLRNPTAPVDTMGCSELYWRLSSPREQRFHTLIALMLSSQTKDTVTAVAMQRLHSELLDHHNPDHSSGPIHAAKPVWDHANQTTPSTLTIENILAVPSARLNELIGSVGFHNNKTKYIKATAALLRDNYGSDIPSTINGLIGLPGVGPKMAYLCMSAAWGRDEGIGVDVHVHRITNLWGWNKTKTPEATRASLEGWLPKDKWHEINKLLVGLGQTVCLPVGRKCGECDLAGTGLCKSEIKGSGISRKKNKNRVEVKRSPSLEPMPVIKVEAEE
ncbi:DNA N-glycosylase and apurinic/apyrimidinic (AP) lyase [Myotisia sp. PD_48]|nr:DNA N-glycosylase and apurinic/apyrimidinic (AP) lyase [Myotisia sp. PD_48]